MWLPGKRSDDLSTLAFCPSLQSRPLLTTLTKLFLSTSPLGSGPSRPGHQALDQLDQSTLPKLAMEAVGAPGNGTTLGIGVGVAPRGLVATCLDEPFQFARSVFTLLAVASEVNSLLSHAICSCHLRLDFSKQRADMAPGLPAAHIQALIDCGSERSKV